MILLTYIAYKLKEIQQQLEPLSHSNIRTADAMNRWINNRLDKADPDRCCTHDAHENYCVCCLNEHQRCRIED